MNKITFCIPSKNNLRYLKACIKSIRKNSYRNDHDIIIFVDKDTDGTVEWLKSVCETDPYTSYIVNPNLNVSLYGIGKAYDECIMASKTDVVMVFHADMMLGKHADLELLNKLIPKSVLCSTRIEPPLHPPGKEKIVQNFGLWPEEDVADGFKKKEFDAYVEICKQQFGDKTTNGCFAPWMVYKQDFIDIGMHDYAFKSAREDSDVFNRMKLNNFTFIQSWRSFVYHLTCRGGQFEHGVLTTDHSKKSVDWQKLMHNSTLEFIRKWGTVVLTDEYLHPIVKSRYDVTFSISNCNEGLITVLEPWARALYIDCSFDNYITNTQPDTSFNLKNRIFNKTAENNHDITIEFDARKLNNENFKMITELLPDILDQLTEAGEYEYDIFTLKVIRLQKFNETIY